MPELGRLAQHVGGEVLGGVPLQRVWREPLVGERGRRLGDHAFVVVEPEESMVLQRLLHGRDDELGVR